MKKSALLLILFLLISSFSATTAQSDAKIRELEKKISQLENRIALLESQLAQKSPASQKTQPSSDWKNLDNWRKLKRGMSTYEVERILGTPRRIKGGYLTQWFYSKDELQSSVTFDNSDLLFSWIEPK